MNDKQIERGRKVQRVGVAIMAVGCLLTLLAIPLIILIVILL